MHDYEYHTECTGYFSKFCKHVTQNLVHRPMQVHTAIHTPSQSIQSLRHYYHRHVFKEDTICSNNYFWGNLIHLSETDAQHCLYYLTRLKKIM